MLRFHLSCTCFYPWETQGNEVEKWFFLVLHRNEQKDSISIKTNSAKPGRWNSCPLRFSPEWRAVRIYLVWGCLDRHRNPMDKGSVRTGSVTDPVVKAPLSPCRAFLAIQCLHFTNFQHHFTNLMLELHAAPLRSAGHRGECPLQCHFLLTLYSQWLPHHGTHTHFTGSASTVPQVQIITPATWFVTLLLVK